MTVFLYLSKEVGLNAQNNFKCAVQYGHVYLRLNEEKLRSKSVRCLNFLSHGFYKITVQNTKIVNGMECRSWGSPCRKIKHREFHFTGKILFYLALSLFKAWFL